MYCGETIVLKHSKQKKTLYNLLQAEWSTIYFYGVALKDEDSLVQIIFIRLILFQTQHLPPHAKS
jgi:hypothetical protein